MDGHRTDGRTPDGDTKWFYIVSNAVQCTLHWTDNNGNNNCRSSVGTCIDVKWYVISVTRAATFSFWSPNCHFRVECSVKLVVKSKESETLGVCLFRWSHSVKTWNKSWPISWRRRSQNDGVLSMSCQSLSDNYPVSSWKNTTWKSLQVDWRKTKDLWWKRLTRYH